MAFLSRKTLLAPLVFFLCFTPISKTIADRLAGTPKGWRLIDVSGNIPVDRRVFNQAVGTVRYQRAENGYRYIKVYDYGLDSSNERLSGSYSAYVNYDTSLLDKLAERLKKGDLRYDFYMQERDRVLPEVRRAAVVQTVAAEPYKDRIAHISFFIKTRPSRAERIAYKKYGLTEAFVEKLIDEKSGRAGYFVQDFIRTLDRVEFQADMEVYVHTPDAIRKYFTTSEPEKGEGDWQRFTSLVAVPKNATAVTVGFSMQGIGRVWADDFVIVPKSEYNESQVSRFISIEKARLIGTGTEAHGYLDGVDNRGGLLNRLVSEKPGSLFRFRNPGFEHRTD